MTSLNNLTFNPDYDAIRNAGKAILQQAADTIEYDRCQRLVNASRTLAEEGLLPAAEQALAKARELALTGEGVGTKELRACWNTGRMYGASGQRIAAYYNGDGAISFVDTDRGIDGIVDNVPQELVVDLRAVRQLVMAAYDSGNYRTYMQDHDLRCMLSAAAAAAPGTLDCTTVRAWR